MSLQSIIGMFKDKQESKCPVCEKAATMRIEVDGPLFCSTVCYEEWFQPSKKDKPQALECKNCDMKIADLVKESFCSVACYNEYNEPCTACGEEGADVNGQEYCNNRCIDKCERKPQVLECKNCSKEITELFEDHYCSVTCYNERVKPCINCGEEGAAPIEEDGPLLCGSQCYDQWNEKQQAKQEEKRENALASANNIITQRLSEKKKTFGKPGEKRSNGVCTNPDCESLYSCRYSHCPQCGAQGAPYTEEKTEARIPELLQGLKRKAVPEPEEDEPSEERPQKRRLKQQMRCLNCNKPCLIRDGKQACDAECAAEYDKKKNQNVRRSKRDKSSSSSDVLFDRFQSIAEQKLQALPKKDRASRYNYLLTEYNKLSPFERQKFIETGIDSYITDVLFITQVTS